MKTEIKKYKIESCKRYNAKKYIVEISADDKEFHEEELTFEFLDLPNELQAYWFTECHENLDYAKFEKEFENYYLVIEYDYDDHNSIMQSSTYITK